MRAQSCSFRLEVEPLVRLLDSSNAPRRHPKPFRIKQKGREDHLTAFALTNSSGDGGL